MRITNDFVNSIAIQCRKSGIYLATAESCTGGLLGHLITNLSGSSDFYLGGQVTYSNTAKKEWLGVPQATLDTYSAVSEETVLAMASGIRRAFSQSFEIEKIVGVSISGVAGPTGGTAEKPVGTVWFGFSMHQNTQARHYLFKGDRESIKRQAAEKALEMILENIM